MRCCVAILGCLGLALSPARADEPTTASPVSLVVVPAAEAIRAGDPLLLKSVIRNDGKGDVPMSGSFHTDTKGLRIEVRRPDGKEFERFQALGDGRAFYGPPPEWKLKAGKTVACYSHVYLTGTATKAGTWQVRVVSKADGKEVVSPTVTIAVTECPEKAREAMREYGAEIDRCVESGIVQVDTLAKALEAVEALGPCEAGRAVTQARILRDLRDAGSARARALALDELKKYRDGLSPVAREYLDLLTAKVFLDQERFEDARPLLDAVKDPSIKSGGLRAQLYAHDQKK